jgi:hypothetical protein
MNTRGQTPVFYLFMVGVIIFLVTFGLSSSMVTNSSQVYQSMDCDNSSISTTEHITCTTIDLVAPFFLSILTAIGGMILLSKVV